MIKHARAPEVGRSKLKTTVLEPIEAQILHNLGSVNVIYTIDGQLLFYTIGTFNRKFLKYKLNLDPTSGTNGGILS